MKQKNKKMLHKYTQIIDEIKEQILFINASVCVISIISVFEERDRYYPQIELQDFFNENSD